MTTPPQLGSPESPPRPDGSRTPRKTSPPGGPPPTPRATSRSFPGQRFFRSHARRAPSLYLFPPAAAAPSPLDLALPQLQHPRPPRLHATVPPLRPPALHQVRTAQGAGVPDGVRLSALEGVGHLA
ncbi:hypothetical protein CSUB01_02693 [Colletotrichum sublineola]|uniref:Uncharacterized protein n=1 Tax=Colletotrichum sublineola TaxID=1173701 RepID=A0A066X540_COLSU|nr:hypothetical protein CSUB01_02693 [Colletotrichum sublineola]